jgi:hypothetical protein
LTLFLLVTSLDQFADFVYFYAFNTKELATFKTTEKAVFIHPLLGKCLFKRSEKKPKTFLFVFNFS